MIKYGRGEQIYYKALPTLLDVIIPPHPVLDYLITLKERFLISQVYHIEINKTGDIIWNSNEDDIIKTM